MRRRVPWPQLGVGMWEASIQDPSISWHPAKGSQEAQKPRRCPDWPGLVQSFQQRISFFLLIGPAMSHPFDATLKEIIAQHPEDFVSVFGLPQAAVVTALNVDLSTLTAATDVAFGFGQPITEIVDLNFQSGPDLRLPARLHLYNAAFHLRYSVPVRSVAILLRAKADAANLTGKLVYGPDDNPVQFPYEVVRMWQRPVEPFLDGGLGLLPLATLCQLPEPLPEALRKVVREIDRRLAQEIDHAQAVRLMTAAFILTGMRVAKEDLASIYRGVRIMHESTAYDVILDEGRIEGQIRLLFRLGRKRFGQPDAQTEAELSAIKDSERLDRMADAILTVGSWQELLATS